ncbi:uncharacterized protein DFL_005372 [Arthrobotrys flagrans]|uniref:Yeast cell wall synthesis Kre9/Knh1-like N-terminal domain-containing protein n=1 Tax=Arthrobotrys flagrans TaxID=97331 RepID=A0A437A7G0_ARTFL|nr:hypothetical protein DFL_005372 [Arthrobotrys flagrans]
MVSTRSLLLFSLTSLASAETIITYPAGGESFPIGQPVTIKWESDAPNASVGLSFCWNGADNCTPIATGRRNTGEFTWTPKDTVELRDDYIIFMAVGTDPIEYVVSSNFEVVAASSSTISPSSTSGSGTSSTGGATTTTGSSTTGAPLPSTSDDSTSNGTIIGAAVGAVAGVVILAVIGFIWMRKRNQKKLAEARRSTGQDDVEAGEKKKPNGSGSVNGAAVLAADKKKPAGDDETFASSGDKKHNYAGSSNEFAMAELPAQQQEVFEMAAVPASGPSNGGGAHFFAMELDSREIPRPGTSTVKPDNDPTSKPPTPAAVTHSVDKGEGRGVSIDGTTVNSETERPTSMGSIEQIKESSREGSQRDLTQQNESAPRPPANNTPGEDNNGAGPSNNRDSTPQIGSIPKLGGFDFDTAKF